MAFAAVHITLRRCLFEAWCADGARCCLIRNWPTLDSVRGRFMFVLVDSTGKYGPLYRGLFPGLRNGTFFVSQPGAWLPIRA